MDKGADWAMPVVVVPAEMTLAAPTWREPAMLTAPDVVTGRACEVKVAVEVRTVGEEAYVVAAAAAYPPAYPPVYAVDPCTTLAAPVE